MATIKIKRIYEEPDENDGFRVLVDRLWPRGVSKEKAKLDLWLKEIAPSSELRKWFNHQPERFREFKKRYKTELDSNSSIGQLEKIHKENNTVTLLYSAHDPKLNQAVVLLEYLHSSR
jgi:uncharacterized protein YeaO (DUF488 family)